MKLFDYQYHEDFGHEWYFQLLTQPRKFALIDCSIQWDDYPSEDPFPCIIFGIGPYDLFGFTIRYRRFEIRLNLLQFKPRNLQWYRKEYHTELTEEDYDALMKALDEPPREIEGLRDLMNRSSPFE